MKVLTVLYDARCGLCCRCTRWLAAQPKLIALRFFPFQSPDLGQRFPGIEAYQPDRDLVVVADTGEVYAGAAAWIMCLYALEEYREWSFRLAHSALLPMVGRMICALSQHRLSLSQWMAQEKLPELPQSPVCGAGCEPVSGAALQQHFCGSVRSMGGRAN